MRRQKLLAAGLVMAGGFALAWPLRRSEPLASGRVHSGIASPTATPAPPEKQLAASTFQASAANSLNGKGRPAGPQDAAADPFTGVPAPSAANEGSPQEFTFASQSNSLPSAPAADEPSLELHIVHEGDSLARMAARYLGDEARALEIFDLNRDVLDNPHVLPLGVELRIPHAASLADPLAESRRAAD